MSLEILNQITASEEAAYDFLKERGVLRQDPPFCTLFDCQLQMTLVKRKDCQDGVGFRCPKHHGRKCSIRRGSFFENNKLPLTLIIKIIYCWAHKVPNKQAEDITAMRHATLSDWYAHMRRVCSHWLVENPAQLGGVGMTVQIDESHLGK